MKKNNKLILLLVVFVSIQAIAFLHEHQQKTFAVPKENAIVGTASFNSEIYITYRKGDPYSVMYFSCQINHDGNDGNDIYAGAYLSSITQLAYANTPTLAKYANIYNNSRVTTVPIKQADSTPYVVTTGSITTNFQVPLYSEYILLNNSASDPLQYAFPDGSSDYLNMYLRTVTIGIDSDAYVGGTINQAITLRYNLQLNLELNSSYYNKMNTRLKIWTPSTNEYREMSYDSLTITNCQYRAKIYDIISNDLIYEDLSDVYFTVNRTIDIDSFRMQNNAGEPIITNMYDSHGHYQGVESFTDTAFNTQPDFGDFPYGTSYVIDNYQNHSNVLYFYGSETIRVNTGGMIELDEVGEVNYAISNASEIEFWAYQNLSYSGLWTASIGALPLSTQYQTYDFSTEYTKNMSITITRGDSEFLAETNYISNPESGLDDITIAGVYTSSKWYHYRISFSGEYCLFYIDFQYVGRLLVNTSISRTYLSIFTSDSLPSYFDAFDWSTSEGYYVNRNKDLNTTDAIISYIENTPRYSGNNGYYQGALSFTEDLVNNYPDSISYHSGTVYVQNEYDGHNKTLYSNGTQYDSAAEMDVSFFSIPLNNATEVSFWTYVNLSSQLDAYFYLSNIPMTSYADIESSIGLDFSFNRNNGDIEGPAISETIFTESGWYHLRVAYIPITNGERIYTIYEDYSSQATVTVYSAANFDWNYLSVMVVNNTYLDAIDYNTAANYFPDRNKLLNCSTVLFTYLQTQPIYEFDWAGWYQGAISFDNDTINTRPSNGIMSWSSGSYHVKADQTGHEKVISNIYNEANNAIRYDIEQNTDITNFEFWFYPNGTDNLAFYSFSSIPSYKVLTWHDLSYLTDNQWYHIRFQFDYLNLQYKYYVNQNLVSTTNYADTPYGHIPESNNIYSIWFYTGANIQNYSIDAVDYSEADGYFINRNTLLNYSTDILTQVEATANYDRTGWYQGYDSFTDDVVNQYPTRLTNSYLSNNAIYVLNEYQGHKKVLNITRYTQWPQFTYSASSQITTTGNFEFWLNNNDMSSYANHFHILNASFGMMQSIRMESNKLKLETNTTMVTLIDPYVLNQWYHIRWEINIANQSSKIFVNGILAGQGYFITPASTNVQKLTFGRSGGIGSTYLDSIDDSSRTGFFINRNTLLNYSTALNSILENANYNHTGHFQGAYSFDNDVVNRITNPFSASSFSYVIDELDGHRKVIYQNNSISDQRLQFTPTSALTTSTIEFWIYLKVVNTQILTLFRSSNSQYSAYISFYTGGLIKYPNGTTITTYSLNTWNHIRISTDFSTNLYNLFINNNPYLNIPFSGASPNDITYVWWYNTGNNQFAIDGVDISTSSNFFINRNMLENQSTNLASWNAYPNWNPDYKQGDQIPTSMTTPWTNWDNIINENGTKAETIWIANKTDSLGFNIKNVLSIYDNHTTAYIGASMTNPTASNLYISFWMMGTGMEIMIADYNKNLIDIVGATSGRSGSWNYSVMSLFGASTINVWQHYIIYTAVGSTTHTVYQNTTLMGTYTNINTGVTTTGIKSLTFRYGYGAVGYGYVANPTIHATLSDALNSYLDNTTYSMLPMNYTAASLIEPTYDTYDITYDSSPFAVSYETYDDSVLLSLQTNPYTYTLTNFTPAFYLYRVFDLYENELKSGALYPNEDELIYTPPNTRECFISLADQQNQYLDWENYKIYIEDNLIYSNRFYEEIGETVTIDIYSRFDTLLATTTHRVTRDQNWIPIELTRYTLKIYNQQANFIHYNITLDQDHYPAANIFWSEWLAPGEIGKNYLYPDYYSVTLMANESGTPSYVEYNLNFNTDDVLLISSSNTIFAVLQNINALNSSIDTQFTYVSLNFTNTNSQIGNQTTLITINFENINTTIDDMLLSQVWSFEFMNTSLGSLLLYSENSFEYINSTVGEMLQLEWNSFEFLNSSVEDIIVEQLNSFGFYNTSIATLLTQSQNSFTFLNSSLDSLFSAANNSFEFMNTSLGELLLYNQNSFDFLNTSVGDLLLTTANSFDFINVTVGDLLLQSNNSFAYLNVTVGDIMVEMLNAFGFMNTSLEDLLLYSGNSFEFMNTSLEDLLMYSENSFEFMNVTLGDLLSASSNSFEFMNTSLGDLLLYSENSFEFMNVTLGDLLMNVENSFNFTNASLLDLILYSQNGFDFLNTSMGDLLLSTENSFGFMNVTLNDLLVSTANSFAFANTTMNDILMYTTNSFAYLNTTVQGIYLLSENSFLFTNSSLNQIIAQNYNGFEFLNSSVVSLYNIQENSFVFINSSVASLLTQSQNSFNYLNSSVSSIYGLSIMSFEFLNSSVQNMETTMAQNFTFLFSNISSNQLEVLTQFNIVNSNVTNNSMAILSQLYAVNSSITDLILNLESNVLLVNDSIYTAILNVSTALALDNNNILGNISITYQQNEFLTELFKKTMFSDLLNWSGVGYNYSLIENQIDTVQFANQFKNDTLQLFLRYQNRVQSMILTSQTSIDQMLPNEDVEYRVKSLTTGEFLNEWEPIENKSINIGYYEEIIPATPEDIQLEIKDYLMLALFGVVAFSAMALLYFRSKIDLENSVESKKEKPSKKTPNTRDTRKLFFSEPEPYRPKKSTKVGSSLGGVLAVIIIVFVIVYLMIHFGV